MFAHLSAAAAILAMLCAVLKGVIPNLAKESPRSRAFQSWLDIWLPLILAVPIAAVPLLPGAGQAPAAILLASQSVIPVALVGFLIGVAMADRRVSLPFRCIDGHHVLALLVLGVLLLGASYIGRLSDWNGHLLLTAAMLWLWTVSADPKPSAEKTEGERDRVFIVDWTGPLSHPVDPVAQGVLILCPALLLFAVLSPLVPQISRSAALNGPSTSTLLAVALIVPAVQAAVLARVWQRLGPASAIRSAVSTIILTVLLGVGVLCVRLVPWGSLLMSVSSGDDTAYAITDLTGVTVLFPVAMLILTIALLGLSAGLSRRTLPALGWGIMAVAVVCLGVGIIVTASHWPVTATSQPTRQLESAASMQGRSPARAESPESLLRTFLQDDSI